MTDEPARTRFLLLSLVRLGGVALVMLGVAVMTKRWVEPADLLGGALLVGGAFFIMGLPRLLVRRWRTPPPR